jgi:hypothetical protein
MAFVPRISRLALVTIVVALATPVGAASAASVTAQAASKVIGFQGKGSKDGVRYYAAPYRATITIAGYVRDDYGAPIAGAIVHLTTIVHDTDVPAPLADVKSDARGSYRYSLKPGSTYTYFVAVDAASAGTAGEGPALHVGVAPNIDWTTPLLGQRGAHYRFDGTLDIPSPATAGTVVLTRLDSKLRAVRRLASRTPSTSGAFHFVVTHRRSGRYFYRVAFVPTDRMVWAPLAVSVGVRFTRT